MRTIRKIGGRRTAAALVLAAALALAGCGGASVADNEPVDLSTPKKAGSAFCGSVLDWSNEISRLAESSAPGERNRLRQWSLDPNDEANLTAVREALKEKVEECRNKTPEPPSSSASASGSPSPSATPSASPSSTGTPTSTATSTPSATPTATPTPKATPGLKFFRWDQVVKEAPELRDVVNDHEEEIDFRWNNVQRWAKLKYKGEDESKASLVDARIILVFDDNDLSDREVRKKVGVTDSDVPVVHVTECTEVTGDGCNPESGFRVILAPINHDGKRVRELHVGAGMVMEPDYSIVSYETDKQYK